MSDLDDAMAVLGEVVPIGRDHPQVAGFEEAVLAGIAARPSPTTKSGPTMIELLGRISDQLDEVLTILRGGVP